MAPLSQLFARLKLERSPSSTLIEHVISPRSPLTSTKTSSAPNPSYSPGAGAFNPHHIDNRGFFALFALLGAAMVLASIWFFFWAKNGGFTFKKHDWDDYKSTVLRRKGPNGTTLSGATKTTKLGGGSVVAGGNLDADEKAWRRGEQTKKSKGRGPRGNRNNDDNDVRAYRHEKPARVGGLNRESDAVGRTDFAYSDVSSQPEMSSAFVPINTPRKPKRTQQQQQHPPTTPSPLKNNKKSPFYATPGSNTSTDSHRPLRPNAATPGSAGSTPTRSRNPSPKKRESVPGSFYTEPLDFETRYSQSDAGISEDSRGTKAYFHPIPGLGSDNGHGGRGGGGGGGGFRRGRGRRDSLSDSEGETAYS